MKKPAFALALLASTLAYAGGVADKKQRDAVNEAADKAAADIKSCGKKFKVVFDWKAYDAIDWKAIGYPKENYYASERSNLAELGLGLDRLCADKDYKAAFVKINTITYKPTNDTSIKVKAVISGGSMVLHNYSFGGTRGADDYETAAKTVL